MAKLSKRADTPAPPAPAAAPQAQQPAPIPIPAPVQAAAPAPVAPVQAPAPAAPVVPPAPVQAPAPAGPVPFQVQDPGAAAQAATAGPKPNLVQKRQSRIAEAINGRTFVFKEERRGVPFTCFCGSNGKNAIVLAATETATGVVTEVLCGGDCLKYTGAVVPKTARQPREGGAPGISKQQKFAEALAKFVAPYRFVREQIAQFQCFCGGRGQNQIVCADANGLEFSVGRTCVGQIPGVEVPKPVKAVAVGSAPAVAGLKTSGAVAPPTFMNVK